jgi:hypothetical protein
MYNQVMAKHVIHISDAEEASDFASLLDRVRAGAEIVIEHDARPRGRGASRRTSRAAVIGIPSPGPRTRFDGHA